MELDINSDRIISNPDATTIARELGTLYYEQFAILRKDDLTFIQTLVDPEVGLVLEYQEGSPQEHFGTVTPPKTIREVIEAFISYSQGSDKWKDQFTWTLMELTQADFTVVVLVLPEAVDQIDSPFDCEERVELPDIGIDNIIKLYSLLVGTTPKFLEAEFSAIAETTPAGLDAVLLVNVPVRFQKNLSTLTPDVIGSLAAQWHATDHFPVDEYDETAAADLITALSSMATGSLSIGKVLIACVLQ